MKKTRKNVFVCGIFAAIIALAFTACDQSTGNQPSRKTITGIAVTKQPTKTVYTIGEQLNTAGMMVTASYSDGTEAAVTGYTTSGFSSTTGGDKTVTVTYEGKTATFTVTVLAANVTLTGIEVTTEPTKNVYSIGEQLNTDGMVVTASYSNDTTAAVTGYTTSGFNSATAGQKIVTVTYEGKTATFTVTVNAATATTLTGIEVTTQPTKNTYNIGETLDTTGMVVTASYSDGTDVAVTDYTTSGFSSTTGGDKTVTVTYEGKTATFTVTVIAVGTTISNIEVQTEPTKTVYTIGESLDTTGMVVVARYSDGTTVAVTDYTTSGFNSSTEGQKTVTVTFSGKTATFTVTVYDPTTITNMISWLAGQPANTAATAYTFKLNASSLGGDANTSGSVGYLLSENNTKFVSLDLSGSTFNSIEDSAFYGCANLTGIILPDIVTSIGESAFNGCTGLVSVTLPANAGFTSIGNSAFNRCTSLTSINIPDSVTRIGIAAFQSCAKLTDITIPSSITSIEGSAFNRCTGLTSVTIPSSVTSIGDWSFGNNANLASVTFQGTITADNFHTMGSFFGDLRDKFYAVNSTNGTPGTYTTTAPVSASSVWTLQK
jgi:uncharacterized protein YkuJ